MYLLETSALLRANGVVEEPLGKGALSVLESENRKIFISIVSVWELVNLEKAGKIQLDVSAEIFLKTAMEALGCDLLRPCHPHNLSRFRIHLGGYAEESQNLIGENSKQKSDRNSDIGLYFINSQWLEKFYYAELSVL